MLPSLQGKVEFEAMEEGQEDRITGKLLAQGVKAVFDRRIDVNDLESVVLAFNDGSNVETGEDVGANEYEAVVAKLEGLDAVVGQLADQRRAIASAVEFVLEGLHLHKLLNKASAGGRSTFTG